MKKLNYNKGFTLIELLVVIAIIGILSGVVLVSVNSARLKASDVAVRSDLSTIRTAVADHYDSLTGSYNITAAAISGGACSALSTVGTVFENTNVQSAFVNAFTMNGGQEGYCNIDDAGTSYAFAFPLKTVGSFWCIDSSGVTRGVDAADTPYDSLTGGVTPALTDGRYGL